MYQSGCLAFFFVGTITTAFHPHAAFPLAFNVLTDKYTSWIFDVAIEIGEYRVIFLSVRSINENEKSQRKVPMSTLQINQTKVFSWFFL
jgi:hypothetical protein